MISVFSDRIEILSRGTIDPELAVDNDGNMILTEGLVLQAESYWKDFLKKDVEWKNNSYELYFEEADIEGFGYVQIVENDTIQSRFYIN